MKFKGIFTALLTPFDKNDNINEKALASLVEHNLALGVKGFYVGGSTGEAFLLSTDERRQIMEIVKEASKGKATLIAHVGSISEREATLLGKHAAALGYDAVSSVAPFYYKFSFSEIKNYYFRVAEASCLPMLVYHIPSFSGVNMGVKEMGEFLSDDRFMGIKYTSTDLFTLESCKAAFPDKIIYNGFDEVFLAGLSMGADGAIGSTYNFMADKFVTIERLFAEGKIAEAQAAQQEANRMIRVLCRVGVMAGEKEILCQLGLDFGQCRRPFAPLGEEARALIKKEILPFVTPIA